MVPSLVIVMVVTGPGVATMTVNTVCPGLWRATRTFVAVKLLPEVRGTASMVVQAPRARRRADSRAAKRRREATGASILSMGRNPGTVLCKMAAPLLGSERGCGCRSPKPPPAKTVNKTVLIHPWT